MARPILTAPHFHNEEAAFAYVEAHLWPNGPTCPHCGNADEAHIGRLSGKSSRPGLRKCYACRKTFTVRIGSIFEDSHFPLHLWLQAIQLIAGSKKGISTRQIQRTFNCSMKTAWFLMHRIREIMKVGNDSSPLGGQGKIIEADTTFVGRKPGTKVARGGHRHMNPVLALVERHGGVRSAHLPNVRAHNLGSVLDLHASRAAKCNVAIQCMKPAGDPRPGNGGAREGAGRPAGSVEKVMRPSKLSLAERKWDYAEKAFDYAEEALDVLAELMRSSEVDSVKLGAVREILNRALGKAPQHIDITALRHTEIVYRSAAQIRQSLLDRGVPKVLLDYTPPEKEDVVVVGDEVDTS
jgi:transposase-like protein